MVEQFVYGSLSVSHQITLTTCCYRISYVCYCCDILRFQARCRRRRLNLALVFCVDCVLHVFLSQGCMLVFVVFDLVLSCGVIVISPCCMC